MRQKRYQLLHELRLAGIANVLDRELKRADKNGTAVTEVLWRLFSEEFAHRQERSMLYRLHHAKIPWDWTLDTFPFDMQPGVQKSHIMGLSNLSFIERAENIVFIGEPGTGKPVLPSVFCGKRFSPGTAAVITTPRIFSMSFTPHWRTDPPLS